MALPRLVSFLSTVCFVRYQRDPFFVIIQRPVGLSGPTYDWNVSLTSNRRG